MLTPAVILDALMQSLQAILPAGTSLLKAGDTHDSTLSSVWVELWVDRLTTPAARRASTQNWIDLSFTINSLGRSPASPSQVQALAEAIRRHVSRLRVSVHPSPEEEGLLTLQEAEIRDLSRPATQRSAGLLQWTITFRGSLFFCSTSPA